LFVERPKDSRQVRHRTHALASEGRAVVEHQTALFLLPPPFTLLVGAMPMARDFRTEFSAAIGYPRQR